MAKAKILGYEIVRARSMFGPSMVVGETATIGQARALATRMREQARDSGAGRIGFTVRAIRLNPSPRARATKKARRAGQRYEKAIASGGGKTGEAYLRQAISRALRGMKVNPKKRKSSGAARARGAVSGKYVVAEVREDGSQGRVISRFSDMNGVLGAKTYAKAAARFSTKPVGVFGSGK